MGEKKDPFTKTPSTNSPGTCTDQETHALWSKCAVNIQSCLSWITSESAKEERYKV